MNAWETSIVLGEHGFEHGFGTLASENVEIPDCTRVAQVHGKTVVEVPGPDADRDADALWTRRPGAAVAVRTADCVPILIADRDRRFVAAVHAGWRGTAAGIARAAVAFALERSGCAPVDLVAAIGPRIDACCYEVDEPVRIALGDAEAFAPARPGHFMLDLAGANVRQLRSAGLLADSIELVGGCTACHPDRYPSYRRDRTGGRMVHFVRMPA